MQCVPTVMSGLACFALYTTNCSHCAKLQACNRCCPAPRLARGDEDQWRLIPPGPLSGLRGLPELDKARGDRRNFIRVCLLDMLPKLFETLRGPGTTHILYEYGHLSLRLILPTKLTKDSHEVRAGRPIILVLPESLPQVCLSLLIILPG